MAFAAMKPERGLAERFARARHVAQPRSKLAQNETKLYSPPASCRPARLLFYDVRAFPRHLEAPACEARAAGDSLHRRSTL
ncbi:hypothetical protein BRPE64_ACDS16920 [Caballeronia insecticola]|uniref:Uncharacterized protein n=1 Tax=Caballeronia insecticola TaxID=758793 RepID=R4WWW4_9BURK|nr:hypothetical protein BRPE64_ACDS16920 [Caballeronia insecticola]